MASSNSSEDNSKDSCDEDEVLEYMSDGEIVRKASKGFTQLSNCNHSCVLMTDRESLKLNKYQPFQDIY